MVFQKKQTNPFGAFSWKRFPVLAQLIPPKIPETEAQRSLDKWVSLPVSVHGNELDAVWLPKHHHSRFERLHLQGFWREKPMHWKLHFLNTQSFWGNTTQTHKHTEHHHKTAIAAI